MTKQMDTRTGMVSNINGIYLVPSDSNRDAVHGEAILENVHFDRLNGAYAALDGPAWNFLLSKLHKWAHS